MAELTATDRSPRPTPRRPVMRGALLVAGVFLLLLGGSVLSTHTPSDGLPGFVFALLLALVGVSALVVAGLGPESHWWQPIVVITDICFVCLVLVAAWALILILVGPHVFT